LVACAGYGGGWKTKLPEYAGRRSQQSGCKQGFQLISPTVFAAADEAQYGATFPISFTKVAIALVKSVDSDTMLKTNSSSHVRHWGV
jgi:hypothetical protein